MKASKNIIATAPRGTPVAISYRRWSSKKQSDTSSEVRQSTGFETYLNTSAMQPGKEYWDKGESAYHGIHRTKEFGQLLKDCTDRTFPANSVVWVENMDRFGRGELNVVLGDWNTITSAGYRIHVQSLGQTFDASTDQMHLIGVIFTSILAHGESQKKSHNLKEAWKDKRAKGVCVGFHRKGMKSRSCPNWIELDENENEYRLCTEDQFKTVKGQTVRVKMNSATVKGACLAYIVGEKMKTISEKFGISSSNLARLFRSRTLVGFYQPRNSENQEAGEEILTYPALLTMDEYMKILARVKEETTTTGKRSERCTDLFSGLIFNEVGEQLRVASSSAKAGARQYLKRYKKGGNRLGGKTLNYRTFEPAMLDLFLEITKDQIYPQDVQGDEREIAELEATIVDKEANLARLAERAAKSYSEAIEKAIDMNEAELREMRQQLEEKKINSVVSRKDYLAESKTLITDAMETTDEVALLDIRQRLQTAIRRLVEKVTVTIHDSQTASVRVQLKEGQEVVGKVGRLYNTPAVKGRASWSHDM